MKKTLTMLFVILLSVGMIMTGCTTPTPAANTTAPATGQTVTIKIGAIMPMTGGIALYGQGSVNAIKQAVDEINAKGDIKIEFVYEDDEAKPEKSVLAYRKLTSQDKVDVIIGCLTTPCSLAVAELAQADKIPMITSSSTNVKVTTKGDFIFRSCYTDPFQGKGCADLAFNKLDKKTAAIMFDNANDYSIGLADAFEENFKAFGGTITNKETYITGDTDFSAILTKIAASKPEALFIPDYYNTVAPIAKQLNALGVKDIVMLGGDGWDEIVSNAGDEVIGSYYLNHFTTGTENPKGVTFVEKYIASYNGRPNALAALAYDAAYIIADAAKAAGSADHQKIRDAMAATDGDYITGHIKFDTDRNPIKAAVIVEIVKGADGKLQEKLFGTYES